MFRTRAKDAAAVEDAAADAYPADGAGFGSHALHAVDATCARCNKALTENDEARRKADGSYVHLCC
jgi:hypothetical protein